MKWLTVWIPLSILLAGPSGAQVVISEISALDLLNFVDFEGDPSDWIEIENRGGQSIRLLGWSLSDDEADRRKWSFPEKTLFPGQHLVLFASGKNGIFGETDELHTNFQLSWEGETVYLTPPSGSTALPSQMTFPTQRRGYTFGNHPNRSGLFYLEIPTPGAPNQSATALGDLLGPLSFSPSTFVFDEAITVIVDSPDPLAKIYYTRDFQDPDPSTAHLYESPIEVTSTQTLRVRAFRTGSVPSPILTQTFWIGVDPKLETLPVFSFTLDPEDLLGEAGLRGTDSEGQPNAVKEGPLWERPVSIQFVDFNHPEHSFAIEAGMRMHGNASQRVGPKPSFRLHFRGEYGADRLTFPLIPESTLQEFDSLVIRGGHQDQSNPFVQDELSRRLFMDMGQISSLGMFAHVLINGEYYSYYNPVERYDVDFFQKKYASESDWDVVRNRELGEGDYTPFAELFEFIKNHSLEDPNAYREVSKRLDLVNFTDYLLLNIFGSTWDWPGNNVTISHESVSGGRIRYHVWDAEGTFGLRAVVTDDTTMIELLDGTSEESNLFLALIKNANYRQLFASRFRHHFFEDGALTDAHIIERFLGLRNEVLGAIPNFVPTVSFAWVPFRRHYMIAHLHRHGLIEDVNQPPTDSPPSSDLPPFDQANEVGSPDLERDGSVDAKDLNRWVEGYRDRHRPDTFGGLVEDREGWRIWSYPVGKGVRDLAWVDLDSDRRKEMLAVNASYGSLVILPNLGGGNFGAPRHVSVGLGASSLAVGDLNGDGNEDIVSGNDGMTAQSLTLLLNRGDGSLDRTSEVEVLSIAENDVLHTRQIHLADLDKDENLDVFIGFHSGFLGQPNAASILYGDGNGSVGNRSWTGFGSTRLLGTAMSTLADWDMDGSPEPAMLDGTRSSILLNLDSMGRFSEPVPVPSVGSFAQVTLDSGDMDGEGSPDLIVGEGSGGAIRILFNSGAGVFSATDSIRLAGASPTNIRVADLNSDLLPEVITCNLAQTLVPTSTVQIHWNLGNRQFRTTPPMPLGGEIAFPGWITTGDVDGDGDGDFAVSDEFNGRITVYLNQGDAINGHPDITRDGRVDLGDLGILLSEWWSVTDSSTALESLSK